MRRNHAGVSNGAVLSSGNTFTPAGQSRITGYMESKQQGHGGESKANTNIRTGNHLPPVFGTRSPGLSESESSEEDSRIKDMWS